MFGEIKKKNRDTGEGGSKGKKVPPKTSIKQDHDVDYLFSGYIVEITIIELTTRVLEKMITSALIAKILWKLVCFKKTPICFCYYYTSHYASVGSPLPVIPRFP